MDPRTDGEPSTLPYKGIERRSGEDRRSGEERRDTMGSPMYDLELHSRRVNGQRRDTDRREEGKS